MKNLKRFLALMLVLSMMLTAVPFGAFATESDVDAVADDGTAVTTLTLGTKPDNGSTEGNPFIKGTAKSESFRIPAMVTLSDGTLVAAADARWNTTFDGGGLDTIVARSFNKGATWNYTFANYLGDNGNAYNYNSTCFIDPSLAVKTVDGVETIYMLCDLYPYGVALNGNGQQTAPKYDTGFTGDGKLLLSNDNHANYNYYLDGNEIKDSSGKTVSGLTVNAHFDVTGTYNGITYNTNLFFSDSPFKVARTGYLYLTKSTDKGESWSEPTLLPLKTGKEMVCLVGPGRGLVTKDGTIVFPVYSYSGERAKYTALIYSDDGVNWTRTENFAAQISSEAALVELDTGAIRVFFRNENSELTYTDYIQGAGFGNAVTTGVKVNSDTQLSAISYSKTVDGNQVILVSAPAGPNAAGSDNNNGAWRSSGKVFCGIVNKNVAVRSMTWQSGSVAVTPVATGAFSGSTYTAQQGFFAYSCLTELKDNSVAILYEDSQQGWGTGCSYTMDYKTYTESALEAAFGVTFDGDENVGILSDAQNDVEVNLGSTDTTGWDMTVKPGQKVADLVGEYVAYDVTITKADGNAYTDAAEVTLPLGELAGKSDVYPFIITDGKVEKLTATKVDDSYITFTAPHFSVMGVAAGAVAITDTVDVTLKVGETVNKTINDVALTGSNTDTSIATVTWTGTTTEGGTTEKLTLANLPTSTGSIKCYITDGNGNYLDNIGTTLTNATSVADATQWTISWLDTPNWDSNTNNMSRYRVSTTVNGYTYYILNNNGLSLNWSNASNANHWYTAENGFFGSMAGTSGWQFNGTSWTINTSGYGNANAYYVETVTGEASASTAVTIKGNAIGKTQVIVGTTAYNITVNDANATKFVDVSLGVNESKTYEDKTGNYENATTNKAPNTQIATMELTGTTVQGGTTVTEVTTIADGDSYYVRTNDNMYLTASGSTTTDPAQAAKWTFDEDYDAYTLKNGSNYLAYVNGGFTTTTNVWGQGVAFYLDGSAIRIRNYDYSSRQYVYTQVATAVNINVATASSETKITFTGKSVGETTAVVGNTQYNITVTPAGVDTAVDIELEIGETFTYLDTTGNHVDAVTQQPDGTYATMGVVGTTNASEMKLVPVTASTFTTGKRYVIENVRTVNSNHGAYQPDCSVLTSTEAWGGLVMNGPLDVASSQTWSFTPSNNNYLVSRNGEYITITNGGATMETAAQALTFEYVEGSGWLIYYNTDGNNTSNDGDIFLSDLRGNASGEAYGYTTKNDDGNYWNIYELVEESTSEATKVSFTGKSKGTTTAIVGSTQYNITVVAAEIDDEVMNSATDTWTVDPEIQRQRYNNLIGLSKDLYTDESWSQYETARQAAYKKLVEVTNANYTSEADAEAALAELTKLVDALNTAKGKLVAAKTISVRYMFNGKALDIREYKVISTATSLTLPSTIVVDNTAYTVTKTEQTLGVDTTIEVPVTLVGKLGGGFVGSDDIDAGYHNTKPQVCNLVDKDIDGNITSKKKITEMTLTVGIHYDLDLATDTTGHTVEWTTDNQAVATVDKNGDVTAVGEGTTNVTATVKDANGNIVEVNTIPVTVFPKGSGNRYSAVYIEEVDNTTVHCVVNADTSDYTFEVIEGELIYGQFDKAQTGGTNTTALSFFGDPDEAHALVYMKSTNSHDHYYLLHDDNGNLYDGTASGKASGNYYVSGQTTGAGYWQAVGLGNNVTGTNANWTPIKNMVQWAINQGCDGGMGFTRRESESNIGSNLTFASDPMARIEKAVDGVLPTSRKTVDYRRYTEGMVSAVHELVYFKITVTLEAPSRWRPYNASTDSYSVTENGTQYAADKNGNKYSAITYSNASVSDTILPGAYLYTKELDRADGNYDGEIAVGNRVQTEDITALLNAAWTAEELAAGKRVKEYYLMYEIQESDIPKFWIDNIANLDYGYKSFYSAGAQMGAADAEARISVVGTAIDDVVIDFGQKVVYTGLENVHLKGVYVDGTNDEGVKNADGTPRTTSKGTAKYGTVEVTRTQRKDENGQLMVDEKGYPVYDYKVTYTPTQILREIDTVLLYGMGDENHEKIINGFLVYPATTVYYEEGFMINDATNGWNDSNVKQATTEQTFELLGKSVFDEYGMLLRKESDKKHAYGYDPIYDGVKNEKNLEVEKTYASTNTIGDNTTFTFTGTGFDLYADSLDEAGYVSVQLKNAAGKTVKLYNVNTLAESGSTKVTTGQDGTLNSLPIVSEQGLDHGTYTVTLRKIRDTKEVRIDGVRIFGTLADSSVFNIDLEDNPEYYQLRDYVLYALGVKENTSVDYKKMPAQVYALLGADQSAAILSAKSPYGVDKPTIYVTAVTKKTETVTTYTDGSKIVEVVTETTETEYSDENRTKKLNSITTTETDTAYYNADGTKVDKDEFKATGEATVGKPVTEETTVNSVKTVETPQDLLDNGPKNEIYLHENETLEFKVTTNRMLQIGLKAPASATTYSVSYTLGGVTTYVAKEKTMEANVDMFYELGNGALENEAEYTVIISNIGDNLLSVTDLKICDDPNAAFVALTEKDIETALTVMGCGDPCAKGHSYDAVVTDPTCTEAGYTTYTCTVCGDSYVGDETEALGHSYDAVVTDPTCTEAGYTTYTCTVCGDSYVGDETEALGHSHEAVVTDPTCTEQGYTTYTCHCGDSYVDDYVDATGHNYSNGSCTDCGAKDPNYSGSSSTIGQIFTQIFGWLIGLIKP